jgi:hypothetical protein
MTERGALTEDSTAVISLEQMNPERLAAMPAAQVTDDMDRTPARPDLLFTLEVGHCPGNALHVLESLHRSL